MSDDQSRSRVPFLPAVCAVPPIRAAVHRIPGARGLLTTSVAFAVLALSFVAWAWASFGSTSSAIAWLSGRPLQVERANRSVGILKAGEIRTATFTLNNYSNHVTTLLGARTNCACAVVDELPLRVFPSESRDISVRIRGGSRTGKFVEAIALYTDEPSVPLLRLEVTGAMVGEADRSADTR